MIFVLFVCVCVGWVGSKDVEVEGGDRGGRLLGPIFSKANSDEVLRTGSESDSKKQKKE